MYFLKKIFKWFFIAILILIAYLIYGTIVTGPVHNFLLSIFSEETAGLIGIILVLAPPCSILFPVYKKVWTSQLLKLGYSKEQIKAMSFGEMGKRKRLSILDKHTDYSSTSLEEIKLILAEKEKENMQKLKSGISEIAGAIKQAKNDFDSGYNVVDKVMGGSSKSNSSSYKAYSDGSINSLREDVKNRKRDLEELRMGIKTEADWQKGMYAKMLADAERRLADAEKLNSR